MKETHFTIAFIYFLMFYCNTVITYKKCTLMKPTEENLNIKSDT